MAIAQALVKKNALQERDLELRAKELEQRQSVFAVLQQQLQQRQPEADSVSVRDRLGDRDQRRSEDSRRLSDDRRPDDRQPRRSDREEYRGRPVYKGRKF